MRLVPPAAPTLLLARRERHLVERGSSVGGRGPVIPRLIAGDSGVVVAGIQLAATGFAKLSKADRGAAAPPWHSEETVRFWRGGTPRRAVYRRRIPMGRGICRRCADASPEDPERRRTRARAERGARCTGRGVALEPARQ